MFYRLLTMLFAASALTAAVAAGYAYFRPVDGPGLVVEQPERVLTDMVVGHEYDLDFRVVNRTNQSLQVLGGGFS
jgi:hypothetical protein